MKEFTFPSEKEKRPSSHRSSSSKHSSKKTISNLTNKTTPNITTSNITTSNNSSSLASQSSKSVNRFSGTQRMQCNVNRTNNAVITNVTNITNNQSPEKNDANPSTSTVNEKQSNQSKYQKQSIHSSDLSTYWTVSHGIANRIFTCRECKGTIMTNEPITVRDARKIRLIYHKKCFSGDPDPRTQKNSSFHTSRVKHAITTKAPKVKGYGKWSTSYVGYSGGK